MANDDQTTSSEVKFDFSAYPENTCFHERRAGAQKPTPAPEPAQPPAPPRVKKERRKRIDPTTFEKQYTRDELEFMSAMQKFKVQSGKSFPTYREVLMVAVSLGYRRALEEDADDLGEGELAVPCLATDAHSV